MISDKLCCHLHVVASSVTSCECDSWKCRSGQDMVCMHAKLVDWLLHQEETFLSRFFVPLWGDIGLSITQPTPSADTTPPASEESQEEPVSVFEMYVSDSARKYSMARGFEAVIISSTLQDNSAFEKQDHVQVRCSHRLCKFGMNLPENWVRERERERGRCIMEINVFIHLG